MKEARLQGKSSLSWSPLLGTRLSVTVILFTLIGVGWTILFLLLSILIAILTGLTFDYLVAKNRLPKNSNEMTMPENFQFWPEAKKGLTQTRFDMKMFYSIFKSGLTDSKMILRWIFLGIVLAGIIRATMDAEHFSSLLGPTISGLALTLLRLPLSKSVLKEVYLLLATFSCEQQRPVIHLHF